MAKTSGWLQKYSGQFAATALPLYAKTIDYRASAFDPSCDPARLECQERCVFVFWHEFIGALLSNWGWCDLNLLVSQHRDAEWLNQTAARMGYKMTRGSSTRGGSSAIRRLTSLGHSSSLVFTPDGPKGPRRQMAPGALYVASELNLPIVPIGVGFSCCKRLKTSGRTTHGTECLDPGNRTPHHRSERFVRCCSVMGRKPIKTRRLPPNELSISQGTTERDESIAKACS